VECIFGVPGEESMKRAKEGRGASHVASRRLQAYPPALIETLRNVESERKIRFLNHPHNPTGTTYTRRELEELAEVCHRHRLVVIADEIHAQTTFEPATFTSRASITTRA
jgi:aspartate/methionine/tyrosine aminotransferase